MGANQRFSLKGTLGLGQDLALVWLYAGSQTGLASRVHQAPTPLSDSKTLVLRTAGPKSWVQAHPVVSSETPGVFYFESCQ